MNYRVKVISMDVHRWSNETGQGDFVCSKSGFDMDTFHDLKQAKMFLNAYFDYVLTEDDIAEDGLIQASLIEDENGYADKDGGYIVDYLIEVIEQRRVRKLF